MITVILSLALMCIDAPQTPRECHPVLVGKNTPIGEFNINQRFTADEYYGGDVIQFHETETLAYSIHRPWLGKPSQNRLKRLKSDNPKDRLISDGCINVDFPIYDKLIDCCLTYKLKVVP